jgi:hypothetical protein
MTPVLAPPLPSLPKEEKGVAADPGRAGWGGPTGPGRARAWRSGPLTAA